MDEVPNPRIGFAFSGGGARSACQVGVLQALKERGIHPDMLAGTSAGAVTAAWYGLYPDRMDTLEQVWLSLRTADIFPGTGLHMLANFVRHGYVHAAHRVERFFRAHFGDARFEDLRVPVAIVAVELTDGIPVLFDSGEIVAALMATIAIPGVFPPFQHRGRLYVDGGVLEHVPITPFERMKPDVVYAIDTSALSATGAARGAGVLDRSARITARANADAGVDRLRRQGSTVHLLRPPLPEIEDGRSFSMTRTLIDAGHSYALQYLDERASALRAVGA